MTRSLQIKLFCVLLLCVGGFGLFKCYEFNSRCVEVAGVIIGEPSNLTDSRKRLCNHWIAKYGFEINGTQYHGVDKIDWCPQVEENVTVYYRPDNIAENALKKKDTTGSWVALLLGVGGFAVALALETRES